MENNDDVRDNSRTCSQYFDFYPRIYSDKCHFYLAWYKKIFYFIRLMPRMYFYAFQRSCTVILDGLILAENNYVGEFFHPGVEETSARFLTGVSATFIGCAFCNERVSVPYRIMAFISFTIYFVMPFLALCLFVASWFITIHSILSAIMHAGLCFATLVFLEVLICCATFLASDKSAGVEKKLYACNCDLSKDIHWSTERIDQYKLYELKDLDKNDGQRFEYPGRITEVKLDDIHDGYGNYIYRLN